MCAQTTEADLRLKIKKSITEFEQKIDDLLSKYNYRETDFLERHIEGFKLMIKVRMQLFEILRDATLVSRTFLTKKSMAETKQIIDGLSRGQRKYYSFILKMYANTPSRHTAEEIIKQNKLSVNRSSIQRLLTSTTKSKTKWQRGNRNISKILNSRLEVINRKKRICYTPKGLPAEFANLVFASTIAVKSVWENSVIFTQIKENIQKTIGGLEEIVKETDKMDLDMGVDNETARKIRDEEMITLGNRAIDKSKNLQTIPHTVGSLKLLFPFLDRALEKRDLIKAQCRDIEALINKIDWQYFDIYLLEDFGGTKLPQVLHNTTKTFAGIVKHDISMATECLFQLELLGAFLKGRSTANVNSRWKFEGIEPFIELKKSEDEKLSKGLMSKRHYNEHLWYITTGLKGTIGYRTRLKL